jgi:hypothetical protein
MRIVGISIIIIGLMLTFLTAFTFFTKEKIVDTGKIEISRKQPHHLNLSPLIGLFVTCVGGLVLWQSTRRNPD